MRHKRFQWRQLFGLVLGFVLISSCGVHDNQPVARVGGRVITVEKFKDRFERGRSKEILAKSTLQQKLNFLEKMIEDEMQVVAAYRAGLDSDPDILKQIKDRVETAMLRKLVEIEIIDKNISDHEIKQSYNNSKKTVDVIEIFLRRSANAKDNEIKDLEKKLSLLQKEIEKGVDFVTLALKYSMDVNAANRGKKKTYKWSTFHMENPVYVKAFSMKLGEISKPIDVKNGYKIIKVVGINDVEQPPFKKRKKIIKRELVKVKGRILEKKYYAWIDELKEKYGATIHDNNIDVFLAVMNDSTGKPDKENQLENEAQLLAKFEDSQKQLPLASFKTGEKITISDIVAEIMKFPVMRRPILNTKKQMKGFLDRQLLPRYVLRYEANKRHLRNNPEVAKVSKEFLESAMKAKIVKQEIDDKVEITEEKKRAYFEQHRDEYKEPEKRDVQEILVSDEKLAAKIVKRARRGESFTKLARQYNERRSTKKKDGKRGYITKSMPVIGKVAFQMKIHEISDPIKNGKKFSIIKLLGIQEAKLKSYEQSEGFVESKLLREEKRQRKNEWMQELKKEISVTIFQNRLDKLYEELREDDI